MTTTKIESTNNNEPFQGLLNLFVRQEKINQEQHEINEELINLMQKLTRELLNQ